ncbi:MAG TPA: peptide ligase PGM1-related protein, partial [Chitinophagaceae bacterium]|nr:peptide ligase PGM1-related protein [Chitinophagaceae bacterium]
KFYEGSKSGGRKTFRESGVNLPDGYEDLQTKDDVVTALAALKRKYPGLRKAVVKMNEGFSGDGNAIYHYRDLQVTNKLEKAIAATLSKNLSTVAKDLSEAVFFEKFALMGGIVEEFLEGDIKTSPSAQCVINPDKRIDIVSTHDQLLGGEDGQIFIGAIFPANEEYNISLAAEARKIAKTLAEKGALGRFAVDFISVKQEDDSWKHYAIEINLRKGGTTHPFLMLQFLTDGKYYGETGEFVTASGNRRCYFASDNVISDQYKGLTPVDLIDIAMFHSLMFDGATQEGVMFHLVGALSEFGKLGVVCIGSTHERAKTYYDRVVEVLNLESTN